MSASIAPEIRQEAARSLLERLREKTALVKFFRYNASAKHGVPIEAERDITFSTPKAEPVVDVKPIESVVVPKPIEVTPSQPAQTVVYANPTTNGTWKTAAATAAVLGGAALSGLAGWALAQRNATDQVRFQQSPYQFLEDKGEHWP